MFVSENLIFTELHKTAGSHIGKLLKTYVGGEQIGKHNRIPAEYRRKFVLGSIRNPWDWYVSLWGYGCDGKGSVFYQTSQPHSAWESTKALSREMDTKATRNPFAILRQWRHENSKPRQDWSEVYKDANDVEAFRQWIRLMFDPARKFDIGEGFGHSPISCQHGLLTYRFFKLFTSLESELYNSDLDPSEAGLQNLWQQKGFVNAFIRQENLEQDFLSGVEKASVELTDIQKAEIINAKANKTNTSSRKSASHYYDQATAELVAQREPFIIKQFQYTLSEILG